MVYERLYLLPLIASIVTPITFIVTYILSVSADHVYPALPYVSETGSLPPESCIFALVLNVASSMMLVIIYIKYRQVDTFSLMVPRKAIPHGRNRLAAAVGVVSCVGLTVLANFQESNALVVHCIGAALCFSLGTVYFIMQTWFARRMCPEVLSLRAVAVRRALAFLLCLITPVPGTAGAIAMLQFKGENRRKWSPSENGYAAHLVSTISEWILIYLYCGTIFSFVNEFRTITVDHPLIKLTNIRPEIVSANGSLAGSLAESPAGSTTGSGSLDDSKKGILTIA